MRRMIVQEVQPEETMTNDDKGEDNDNNGDDTMNHDNTTGNGIHEEPPKPTAKRQRRLVMVISDAST